MSTPPPIALAACPRHPRKSPEAPEKLQSAISELRDKFQSELASSPVMHGSRLVAVLRDSTRAFDFSVSLVEAVWPLRLRHAAVSLIRNDGREALQRAEAKGLEILDEAERENVPYRFAIGGRSEEELRIAESCALLHSAVVEEWTPTRAGAVRAYRRLGRQKEVAAELKVTQQAVSQMLRGARYRELAGVESTLRAWLGRPPRPGLWPLRRQPGSELIPS